ncbi:nuclear transport factor 2 family protein [Nonomuraea angiospora]|uniref:nuclear transport factor 2 family protein n=1 Tax=Nonomuraea angiospora TaxID=46172 RepID=UPI00340F2B02
MTTRLRRGRWTVATSLAACALLVSACGTAPTNTPDTGAGGSPSSGRGESPSAAAGGHAGVAREVRAYVDAVNARDLDALVTAFASDGVVIDVTRPIRGHDAIREWARAEVIGGTLKVVSIAERRSNGQKLLVHWAPAGSGGWRAHYDFTVSGGRVVQADLQYA